MSDKQIRPSIRVSVTTNFLLIRDPDKYSNVCYPSFILQISRISFYLACFISVLRLHGKFWQLFFVQVLKIPKPAVKKFFILAPYFNESESYNRSCMHCSYTYCIKQLCNYQCSILYWNILGEDWVWTGKDEVSSERYILHTVIIFQHPVVLRHHPILYQRIPQ